MGHLSKTSHNQSGVLCPPEASPTKLNDGRWLSKVNQDPQLSTESAPSCSFLLKWKQEIISLPSLKMNFAHLKELEAKRKGEQVGPMRTCRRVWRVPKMYILPPSNSFPSSFLKNAQLTKMVLTKWEDTTDLPQCISLSLRPSSTIPSSRTQHCHPRQLILLDGAIIY